MIRPRQRAEDRYVVALRGELDMGVLDELHKLLTVSISQALLIEVDLAAVTFIDSTVISTLISAAHHRAAAAGTLWVPTISSVQLRRRVRIRGGVRRGDRVGMCRCVIAASPVIGSGSGFRGRAFAIPDGDGDGCGAVRTRAGRVGDGLGSRSASGRVVRGGRTGSIAPMIEFMRGIRTPLSTTVMPASARIASNRAGYFPSRSRMKYLTWQPASSRGP
jgi:anti-sigma B factor antagonist